MGEFWTFSAWDILLALGALVGFGLNYHISRQALKTQQAALMFDMGKSVADKLGELVDRLVKMGQSDKARIVAIEVDRWQRRDKGDLAKLGNLERRLARHHLSLHALLRKTNR